jgi:hypothetical protein
MQTNISTSSSRLGRFCFELVTDVAETESKISLATFPLAQRCAAHLLRVASSWQQPMTSMAIWAGYIFSAWLDLYDVEVVRAEADVAIELIRPHRCLEKMKHLHFTNVDFSRECNES